MITCEKRVKLFCVIVLYQPLSIKDVYCYRVILSRFPVLFRHRDLKKYSIHGRLKFIHVYLLPWKIKESIPRVDRNMELLPRICLNLIESVQDSNSR